MNTKHTPPQPHDRVRVAHCRAGADTYRDQCGEVELVNPTTRRACVRIGSCSLAFDFAELEVVR